jgi:ribosome biogenesis GTPase
VALTALGWDEEFAKAFEAAFAPATGRQDVEPGRVLIEFNHIFRVALDGADGIREIEAGLSGRLRHRAASRAELPAVGDWVAVRVRPGGDRGVIIGVVPRRSCFSRRMAGNITDEQIVAANADVVFIVMALDSDFSLRRLERYLLLARESGASPVVLLTKPDLSDDPAGRVADVVALAGNVAVHVVQPKLGTGVEQVAAYLTPGRTGALLGSSGVGKSTIINRLAGADVQKTREVRESDSKGRHTTSHRELVTLPGGGLIIDTPGMRELQLWDVGDAVRETFDDVEALAAGCRFTDCRHRGEPRCAVQEAVAGGRLAASRLESYLKLQDEIAHLDRQQDERAQIEEKRRNKILTKAANRHIRTKRLTN